MKLEDIKVGVRVRCTAMTPFSKTYNQVGTLMDAKPPLLWVKFDDAKYNNTLVPAEELSVDEDTRCTACYYKALEVVTE
jgi:hypothetical protein